MIEFPGHLSLARLPTPVVPLKLNAAPFENYEVYLKRDDLTGMELSGNKVRKLEFLLKEALKQGAEQVITCGGVQSNHCRATAFAARQLGLQVALVLKRKEEKPLLTGNFLLDRIVGAEIHFVSEKEYEAVDEVMRQIAVSSGRQTYIIPEGGSNAVGAWGYVKAFVELIEQVPRVDAIVVPTGSGGTHAGLLLGKLLTGHPCEVFSVNVCDDAAFFQKKIAGILTEFKQKYGFNFSFSEKQIHILDGFTGEGYGVISSKEIQLIERLARSNGIVLDPVYTAKAWLGFEQACAEKKLPGTTVVFIHTGGLFGTFAYADHFSDV